MNLCRKSRVLARPVAAAVALTLLGCSSQVVNMHSRNRVESLAVVSNSRSITADNVVFVLELRDAREEIGAGEVDRFLSSHAAARVSRALRSEMAAKKQKVDATLAAAGSLSGQDVIFARPNPREEFSEENRVLYLATGDGYRVYFSSGEMDQIFQQAVKKMNDDLVTVTYVHPSHSPEVIAELMSELRRRNVELAHAKLSRKEAEELRILTAAGILERTLRGIGVTEGSEKPLLRTGGLRGRTTSPRLAAALGNKAVLYRVEHSSDRIVRRAFEYLVEKRVIRPGG